MAGRIVVGIDGSEHSQRALAFAVAEARTRDATLDIVHVHQHTTNPGYLYGPMAGASAAGVSRDELERHSLELIDRTLGQAPDDVEGNASRCRGHRHVAWPRWPRGPTCSSWARAAAGASPGCCWAPRVDRRLPTLRAQSRSCPPRGNPHPLPGPHDRVPCPPPVIALVFPVPRPAQDPATSMPATSRAGTASASHWMAGSGPFPATSTSPATSKGHSDARIHIQAAGDRGGRRCDGTGRLFRRRRQRR